MIAGVAERSVVIVAFDGCQTLDVVGPAEVFAGAARLWAVRAADRRQAKPEPAGPAAAGPAAANPEATEQSGPAYTVTIASLTGGLVRGSSGVTLDTVPLDAATAAHPPHTLIVGGGFSAPAAARDPAMVAAVADAAGRARRVASVCTGAFVLAATGLLDGRRATTHWSSARRLAERHPQVTVDPDPIFIRDDNVWTSAGVTAGLDLALALVADDLGQDVAHEIARWLVMFVRRPGGQEQFSTHLTAPRPDRPALRELLDWLPDHLHEHLTVTGLASRACMSPRTFARAFRAEVGVTTATHVEAMRVERAKQLLSSGDAPLATIAAGCGFGTVETFHRVFRKITGTTPERYRQHFLAA
jgi:transcriptional regulator GlxA family with amidase domain